MTSKYTDKQWDDKVMLLETQLANSITELDLLCEHVKRIHDYFEAITFPSESCKLVVMAAVESMKRAREQSAVVKRSALPWMFAKEESRG